MFIENYWFHTYQSQKPHWVNKNFNITFFFKLQQNGNRTHQRLWWDIWDWPLNNLAYFWLEYFKILNILRLIFTVKGWARYYHYDNKMPRAFKICPETIKQLFFLMTWNSYVFWGGGAPPPPTPPAGALPQTPYLCPCSELFECA